MNDIEFTDTVSLDVSTVVTSISGPKRPQDKVLLTNASSEFAKVYKENAQREKNLFKQMLLELILN